MTKQATNCLSLIKSYLAENYSPKEYLLMNDRFTIKSVKKIAHKPTVKPIIQPLIAPTKLKEIKNEKKALPKPLSKKSPSSKPRTTNHRDPLELNQVKELVAILAPSLKIHDTPPPCTAHKSLEASRQEKEISPIPIFITKKEAEHLPFLTNIALAISTYIAPSKVIDITPFEKNYKQLLEMEEIQCIIAPDTLFLPGNKLLSFYKETPQRMLKKLGNKPLLLLTDLLLYYKSPLLKASLWKILLQNLKPYKVNE